MWTQLSLALLLQAAPRLEPSVAPTRTVASASEVTRTKTPGTVLEAANNAVIEFLDAALSHSEYPDMFPMRWEMSFEAETGSLVVDYELPAPENFPTLKAVKFDVLRDTFAQSYWSESEVAQLYESAIYQTCLRTLHDLLAADEAEVISSVTFNGWVNFTDKVRAMPARACILSVQATRSAISQANLLAADPKTTFKKLKGVAGAKLADLAAVVPIMWLKRADDPPVAASDAIETSKINNVLADIVENFIGCEVVEALKW